MDKAVKVDEYKVESYGGGWFIGRVLSDQYKKPYQMRFFLYKTRLLRGSEEVPPLGWITRIWSKPNCGINAFKVIPSSKAR